MEICMTSELIQQRPRSVNYLDLLSFNVFMQVENASSIIQSLMNESDTSNQPSIPDAVNPILTPCGSRSTLKQTKTLNRNTRRIR